MPKELKLHDQDGDTLEMEELQLASAPESVARLRVMNYIDGASVWLTTADLADIARWCLDRIAEVHPPVGNATLPDELMVLRDALGPMSGTREVARAVLLRAAQRLERLDLQPAGEGDPLPTGTQTADTVTWVVPDPYSHNVNAQGPVPGNLVTAGTAGAIWRVVHAEPLGPKHALRIGHLPFMDGPVVVLRLKPVDPHDVSPTAKITDLMLPYGAIEEQA